MFEHDRHLEYQKNNNDLNARYQELLYLRVQVAHLLFPLKGTLPRKRNIASSNRSSAQTAQQLEKRAFRKSILLLMPGR